MSNIFRPSERDITAQASVNLKRLIRAATWTDIVDAFSECRPYQAERIVEAKNRRDMADLGLAVWSALSRHYAPQATREAEEWADRVEVIEREKADRSVA